MSAAPDDRASHGRLLALAAGAAPPPLASTDARRMVRHALLAGAARRRSAAERTTVWAVAGALAVAALVAALVRLAPGATSTSTARPEPAPAPPLRLSLPSRDVLLATPGAQFELAAVESDDRRVELRAGAIAFDVAQLTAGQGFSVVTPHATVRVRGTVFSVAVAGRTEVRVYEGEVQVVDGRGHQHALRQGQSYASDGRTVAQDGAAPLQREAQELARRRAQAAVRAEQAPAPQPVDPAVPEVRPASSPELATAARAGETRAQGAPSLAQARAWLHAGQPERARAAAEGARSTGTAKGAAWLALEADALRSLGRLRAAALAYRRASLASHGEDRVQAGFKAADLLLRELDDARAALGALHAAGADAPGSALRERGMLLRIEALQRLGEHPAAAEVAARYLAEYPESAGAPRLRAHHEGTR